MPHRTLCICYSTLHKRRASPVSLASLARHSDIDCSRERRPASENPKHSPQKHWLALRGTSPWRNGRRSFFSPLHPSTPLASPFDTVARFHSNARLLHIHIPSWGPTICRLRTTFRSRRLAVRLLKQWTTNPPLHLDGNVTKRNAVYISNGQLNPPEKL